MLHLSYAEVPDEAGKPRPLTHVVYKDETGMIGAVTIEKKDPSDADIAAAIREQRKRLEAKARTIRL